MTHAVLGELGIQPLHSAFSQGYEVRPHRAGSQPSVTHHLMKYKLACGEGEKGKGVDTLARLFPSIPLMLWQNSSATHLDIPHLFYFCRECTVLFTCHVSLELVREGLEHLEFQAAFCNSWCLKRGKHCFQLPLHCQVSSSLWTGNMCAFLSFYCLDEQHLCTYTERENMLSVLGPSLKA